MALTRAAHVMASALTPADIHEHLLEQACGLLPACEKSAVLPCDRRGMVLPAGHPRLLGGVGAKHDLPQAARAWWAG